MRLQVIRRIRRLVRRLTRLRLRRLPRFRRLRFRPQLRGCRARGALHTLDEPGREVNEVDETSLAHEFRGGAHGGFDVPRVAVDRRQRRKHLRKNHRGDFPTSQPPHARTDRVGVAVAVAVAVAAGGCAGRDAKGEGIFGGGVLPEIFLGANQLADAAADDPVDVNQPLAWRLRASLKESPRVTVPSGARVSSDRRRR